MSLIFQIDLPAADVERVMAQMEAVFGTSPEDVLLISAKSGHGVSDVLQAIVERVPAPTSRPTDPLKALLFDSSWAWDFTVLILHWCLRLLKLNSYDRYRGVVSLINVQGGTLSKGLLIPQSIDHATASCIHARGQDTIFAYSQKIWNYWHRYYAPGRGIHLTSASRSSWIHRCVTTYILTGLSDSRDGKACNMKQHSEGKLMTYMLTYLLLISSTSQPISAILYTVLARV
jgi:hypothetical protein